MSAASKAILERARAGSEDAVALAEALAAELLSAALAGRTRAEGEQAEQLAGMLRDPAGRLLVGQMADQLFRPHSLQRAAEQWRYLVRRHGAPSFLGDWDRLRMQLGSFVAGLAPGLVMPRLRTQFRDDIRAVILPAQADELAAHLAARQAQGISCNLNLLGEAILGEGEAEARLQAYEKVLRQPPEPPPRCLSVKISAICSQLDLTDFPGSVARIGVGLRRLLRAAASSGILLYCDMEEYRDLRLTVAALKMVLDEEEFRQASAGLALQAYLPESWPVLQELRSWAEQRVAAGGAPLRLRLVKGANLAMEQIEAAQHGWQQAPLQSKAATDAQFKRLLHSLITPASLAVLPLGVASHNLFDVAYALVLRARQGCEERVGIEMLEGMANHQARAVAAVAGGLLVYAPVVREEDFTSAIAYLMRRLDENTAPENFLRALFDLRPETAAWQREAERFRQACAAAGQAPPPVQRDQNRQRPVLSQASTTFTNAADTDWSTVANQAWLAQLRAAAPAPAQLLAQTDLEAAIRAAQAAQADWAALPVAERAACLWRLADELERQRGRLLRLLLHEAHKVPAEADLEISEAVDFARYYAERALQSPYDGVLARPLGVVVVISPWNFPLAIPLGGVLAALVVGNSVLFKPAPETAGIGALATELAHLAGIPPAVVQLIALDEAAGESLITDARVAAVTLTGGSATARLFAGWRPDLRLNAETGGKNCLIITAMADRDAAIKDLVRSAFSHAGQKCSAASLAILEAEVYDDDAFLARLRDAVASLPVGAAETPGTVVPPLIRPPNATLQRGLQELAEGERWLLPPQQDAENPRLISPGIKLGVRAGSFMHQEECFGPLLGVMRAADLEAAIDLAAGVRYGLTAGLHSLDEREHQRFIEGMPAGNLYINKPITGAVVSRQPFGGWKASRFGAGAKAGGPNYVWQFTELQQQRLPQASFSAPTRWGDLRDALAGEPGFDARFFEAAAASYACTWRDHFGRWHELNEVLGESNRFGYRPRPACLLRCTSAQATAAGLVAWACRLAGVPLLVQGPEVEPWLQRLLVAAGGEVMGGQREGQSECQTLPVDSVWRCLHAPRRADWLWALEHGLSLRAEPLLACGRAELPRYLREQSVSISTHRYGNRSLGAWLSADAAPPAE